MFAAVRVRFCSGRWEATNALSPHALPLPVCQVANTYLLSTGLPVEAADHAHVMAAFAADLLALCKHVPGVGRVSARVGLHCGPVAAGFVGRSRRFFRVFGDTGA